MKKKKLYSRNIKKSIFIPLLVGLFLLSVFIAGKFSRTSNLNTEKAVPTAKPNFLKIYPDDPARGREDAKVTVVEFADFQCPFSSIYAGFHTEGIKNLQEVDKTFAPAEPNIIKDYIESGKVRFVWKDFPFIGEESVWAAEAARCAGDQGKFWQFHDYLFSYQKGENKGTFSRDNLKQFALALKLNTDEFNRCFDEAKYAKKVQDSLAYAESVEVNGTPTTFINGRMIVGAQNYEKFKVVIEEELKNK